MQHTELSPVPMESMTEEKMARSLQTYNIIKTKMTERYGAAIIHSIPNETGFFMTWFPKKGGQQAKISIQLTAEGCVRVEFTRNTVEGISNKADNSMLDIRLNDGVYIRMKNPADQPFLTADLHPDKQYNAKKPTQQFIVELVDTVLMA
jgi:hypothetical protein